MSPDGATAAAAVIHPSSKGALETSDPPVASLNPKEDPFSGKASKRERRRRRAKMNRFLLTLATIPGLMKDADKLKLMLLAWNYQNSNAAGEEQLMRRVKLALESKPYIYICTFSAHITLARNGTEGPDLSMMNGLWSHYQSVMSAAEKSTAPNGGNHVSTK